MSKRTFPILLLVLAACGGSRTSSGEGKVIVDGQQNTSTMGNGAYREFGSGDHAIILSDVEAPSTYCWFLKETRRICRENGYVSNRTSHTDLCIDDEPDCLAHEPEGSTEENDRCYVRQSWRTVGNGPLHGSCAKHAAYWRDDPNVQCLFHSHCRNGAQCVDYQCACPDGQTCADAGTPTDPGPGSVDPDPDPEPEPEPEPECRVDAECEVGPAPPGVCTTAQCVRGVCEVSAEPC